MKISQTQIYFFAICTAPAWLAMDGNSFGYYLIYQSFDGLASFVTLAIISFNYQQLERNNYHPRVALFILSGATFVAIVRNFLG